jgi:type I restriction enzyme S subunit
MNVILTTGNLVPENFSRGDSLIALDPREKFDFIPTNPPYGTKMKYEELQKKYEAKWGCESKDDENFPSWSEICPVKTNDGVALFLQYIAFKLKPGGIAVVIIPNGQIMFGKNFGKLRKYLLTQVEIPQIMYTPSGVFKHTGVKTAVLWMRKFLDAEAHSGQPIKFMETAKDLSAPTHIAEISPDQLAKNNWSWDASYYKSQETPELPGCEWKPLGEICESRPGQALRKSEIKKGIYPVIGGGQSPVGYHESWNTLENTILCSSSGSAGYLSKYPTKVWKSDCFSIEPIDSNQAAYIWGYLKYHQEKIYEFKTGSGLPHVYWTDLKKRFKIPVPSLEIQERIVKELDELEACREATRAAIKSQKFVLDKFRRHSNPPFGTHADQIEWKPLGEICEFGRGKSLTKANIIEGYYPVIGGGQTPSGYHNEFNTMENTILCSSSGAYAGFISIYQEKTWISDCFSIKAKPNAIMNNTYLYQYLKCAQEKIYAYQTGSAQPHVYSSDIAKFKIPVPPLEIQEEFVKFYEAKEAKIQKMEADITNAEAQLIDIDALGRTIIEDLIRA